MADHQADSPDAEADGGSSVASEPIESTEPTELERLQERQRQEIKDLKNTTQKLKHAVPKGDKRRQKDVAQEIANLESALYDRHAKETKELKTRLKAATPAVPAAVPEATTTAALTALAVTDAPAGEAESGDDPTDRDGGRRITKASKRRDRKAQRDEEIRRQALDEAANTPNPKLAEDAALADVLRARGLSIRQAALRAAAADYLWQHAPEFRPFLTNDDGDVMTIGDFKKYCDTMRSTAAWGGQPEIQALSHILRRPIHVVQAAAPLVCTGDDFGPPVLQLSYHRHAYRLGEHYNSLRPASTSTEPV